jgi:cation diffusion facilitator family transporter
MMSVVASGQQEKRSAALSSVVAAIFLTSLKIVVGLLTNSLGILAEAAHSGLDLVAALVTFFSVRKSDQPPDDSHLYGHGKIENLSALVETGLLLATCVWIIYEAVQRLFFRVVVVDASLWAFLVMAISIVVDVSRSRILKRAAVKYNSQALEADALHFSTDIWSSSVVILGLIGVVLAERNPSLAFLHRADAIAALGVALIVIYVSVQLGRRCIDGLMDAAPAGLASAIQRAVEAIPGVADCHHIRVRTSGAHVFVDLHASFSGARSLEDVHRQTEAIEAVVLELEPRADVTVHPEPIDLRPDGGWGPATFPR